MFAGAADILCGGCQGAVVPGHTKPPRRVRQKWFPGACWTAPEVAEEGRYQWVFKRDPLGCRQTTMAVNDWRGRFAGACWSAAAMSDILLGGVVCAGLQTAGGDDLLSRPNSEGKGARSTAKHSTGAVVGPL